MNLNQLVGFCVLVAWACGNSATEAQIVQPTVTEVANAEVRRVLPKGEQQEIIVGAERWDLVLQERQNLRVACVVNHTSRSGSQHLVDRLLDSGIKVKRVFAPEHGFRGKASDGEHVKDFVDTKTGLPVVSLYGKTKKPTPEMLADVDLVIFDIQDVGTRFYTYISTLYYLVEACQETNTELLVLDRPNPNGHYIDGPMLDPDYQSFISIAPMPAVHGLTVGEMARYFDHLLQPDHNKKLRPQVIACENYTVGEPYVLPIPPSPNLPNQASIYLYPTLCLFEGTVASIGRGTDLPFQVVGHPSIVDASFTFTPEARPGAAYAKLKGQQCYGLNLQARGTIQHDSIDWALLTQIAARTDVPEFIDRARHFDLIAGGALVREAFEAGTLSSFSKSYQNDLTAWQEATCPWLLYERIPSLSSWTQCAEFMQAQ